MPRDGREVETDLSFGTAPAPARATTSAPPRHPDHGHAPPDLSERGHRWLTSDQPADDLAPAGRLAGRAAALVLRQEREQRGAEA